MFACVVIHACRMYFTLLHYALVLRLRISLFTPKTCAYNKWQYIQHFIFTDISDTTVLQNLEVRIRFCFFYLTDDGWFSYWHTSKTRAVHKWVSKYYCHGMRV